MSNTTSPSLKKLGQTENYFKKSVKPWICWSITSWFSLLAWIFSMRSSSRLLFPLNNITLMLAHGTRGATDWGEERGPLARPRPGPPPWAPIGRGAGSSLPPPLARRDAPPIVVNNDEKSATLLGWIGSGRSFQPLQIRYWADINLQRFGGPYFLSSFDGISPPWY